MNAKEERFLRLAESRMNELIDKFRLVGNLADKRNYSYSDDQAKQILKALEEELRNLKAKFSSIEQKEKSFSFKLDKKND
jgi:hypothetical protein